MFERHGPDVFAVLEVPMVQAALGGEVEVETLDGTETHRHRARDRVGDHGPPARQGDAEPRPRRTR